MISLLRKHGMVIAIIDKISIFIEKYKMVPLKYDRSSYPGKDIKQINLRSETKRKLPEKPCINEPIYSGPSIPAKTEINEEIRPTENPISTIKQF
jgi:hypothetical protein